MPWKPPSVNDKNRYGHAWKKQRAATLRAEPLCRLCLSSGRTVAAVIVDHIIPLGDGGTNEQANLQPMCKRCHDAIKTPSDTRARKHARKTIISIRCVPLASMITYGFDTRVIRRIVAPELGWETAHRIAQSAADGVLSAAAIGDLPECELKVLSDDVQWCRLASQRFNCELIIDAVGSDPRGGVEAEWIAQRFSNEYSLRHGVERRGTQQERV